MLLDLIEISVEGFSSGLFFGSAKRVDRSVTVQNFIVLEQNACPEFNPFMKITHMVKVRLDSLTLNPHCHHILA